MSGGASVPFAVGAAFFNDWQQILCVTAAACFFFFAAYLVWKAERERADGLALRLTPRISVGPIRMQEALQTNETYVLYVQALISNISNTSIEDCRGHFIKVEANRGLPDECVFDESGYHLWSLVDLPSISLRPNAPHYLNIALVRNVTNMGRFRPVVPTLANVPNGVLPMLFTPGTFRFHVVVSGRETVSQPFAVDINTTDMDNIRADLALQLRQ